MASLVTSWSVGQRGATALAVLVLSICLGAQLPSVSCSSPKEAVAVTATSLQCALCELVVKEGIAYVELEKTEKKILGDLKSECPKLFNLTLLAECNQFFDEYGPATLKLILQEVDPAKVCDHVIGRNTTCTDQ